MTGSVPLDVVPLPGVLLGTIGLCLLAAELGFLVAAAWKRRHEDDTPEVGGNIAGAALALLAFYLAFMVSFTIQRFDGRRENLMDEANAIGTTYLRAGYLAEPTASDVRQLLREYTAARLDLPEAAAREEALARSNELLTKLWSLTEDYVKAGTDTPATALFVASVNDTIDIGSKRQVAIATWRVPWTMWFTTFFIAAASMALLGFSAGLRGSRNFIALVVLLVVFSVVVTFIVDLDRPYEGVLTVSQEALLQLQAQIGLP